MRNDALQQVPGNSTSSWLRGILCQGGGRRVGTWAKNFGDHSLGAFFCHGELVSQAARKFG